MAKVDLNPLVDGVHGLVGNLVLSKRKGKTILGRKPLNHAEPTAAQATHRARFGEAVNFGKYVMADNSIRPLYEQIAESREIPVFAVCIADFFHAPSITSISLADYTGQVGDPIRIVASDDVGVVRVDVVLTDDETGTLIERGEAVEAPFGSGHWTYVSTQPATPGKLIQFQVNAYDRPGGTAIERGTKRI